jgi:hypothetical protein
VVLCTSPGYDLDDPFGIRRALRSLSADRWDDFFSQWCQVTELSEFAVERVRDVADQLARQPVEPDGRPEPLALAWETIRDAMDSYLAARGEVGPVPRLEP